MGFACGADGGGLGVRREGVGFVRGDRLKPFPDGGVQTDHLGNRIVQSHG